MKGCKGRDYEGCDRYGKAKGTISIKNTSKSTKETSFELKLARYGAVTFMNTVPFADLPPPSPRTSHTTRSAHAHTRRACIAWSGGRPGGGMADAVRWRGGQAGDDMLLIAHDDKTRLELAPTI